MNDILFVIITLLWIGFFIWERNQLAKTDKETIAKLVNAVIAKNATEARDLNLTDQVKITQPIQTPDRDLVPLDELNQEQWEEQVLGKEET